MCRRRYLHVDGRRLLVGLGSAASLGPRDVAACPYKGPAVACPLDRGDAAATTLDRGTSATARRGYGAAAIGWGSTAAHALGQSPSSHAASLMNRGGA
jgi:hypothetical protein